MDSKQDKFYVVSTLRHETTRTRRGAAEADVRIFTEIIGRKAWIQETPPEGTA